MREWGGPGGVAEEARKKRNNIHVGMIFELCVEKNSELPEHHDRRKYKGRAVFNGAGVNDEGWDRAMFTNLGGSLLYGGIEDG